MKFCIRKTKDIIILVTSKDSEIINGRMIYSKEKLHELVINRKQELYLIPEYWEEIDITTLPLDIQLEILKNL